MPVNETRRSLAEGDDSAGCEVEAGVSEATTVTTSGVAIELERVLLLDRDPLAEDVESDEDVGDGVAPSDVKPAGKVDTFGIVVDPVTDAAAAPANAANPTAGGSNR
jgi:hypothetical protein